eukprot:scaffold26847_cov62-Skeletonema_dohrnii-CCMP3373.AAC.1
MSLRVDGNKILFALQPLHTTSYIDKVEAKSKHPSSQTEMMCVETDFGSYKALVVVLADINQFGACKRYNLRFT